MLLFLYDFTWSLILLISIPLLSSAAGRRLLKRLVPHFPGVAPKKNTVWIHALSVGEVISAQPLIKAIKKEAKAKSKND